MVGRKVATGALGFDVLSDPKSGRLFEFPIPVPESRPGKSAPIAYEMNDLYIELFDTLEVDGSAWPLSAVQKCSTPLEVGYCFDKRSIPDQHPSNPEARLWNPAGASFEQALAEFGLASPSVAIIGGPDVFALFLDRYDSFHLSRAPGVWLPGESAEFAE